MARSDLYQRVEYIACAAASYIDTGIKTSQNLKVSCSYSTKDSSTLLFGGRKDTSSNGLTFGYFSTNSAFVGFGGPTSNIQTTLNPMDGNIHSVVLSSSIYTIDNVAQVINNRGTFSAAYPIFLGTWSNDSNPDPRYFVGKIYSFSIEQNGKYILNLIPCRRKSDNVFGFYDQVKGTFLSSRTGVAFKGGLDMANTTVGAITYKTIINKAITGFNDIQTKLNSIGSLYTTAAGVTKEIPVVSTTAPLSVSNLLLADAFTNGTLSSEKVKLTAPKVEITKTSSSVKLSSSSTPYVIAIGKTITDGSGTFRGKITKSGYLKSGTTSSTSNIGTITPTVSGDGNIYIQAGAYSVSGSVSTTPTSVASISGTGTSLSGVSTTKPATGTDGTDFWAFTPAYSGSNGAVNAKATISTEGYIKDTTGKSTSISVNVTRTAGSSYYIKKLSSMNLSASSSNAVSVGALSSGYYPLTVSLSITGTASAAGYAITNQKFTANANSTVGKIHAGAYTASSVNTASGFTASSAATSWYVQAVPTAKITTAGYIPTGSVSGSATKRYIPAATIKNGFTTVSGMVSANTANYVTQYNSTDKCVDIIFNS